MAKLLIAMGLSLALFGGLVGAFYGTTDSITVAMVTHPRGSLVSSLM